MIEPVFSNIHPLNTRHKKMEDVFFGAMEHASQLTIASGYISTDSVTELKKLIELNQKPKLNLIIGMHHFEGFTRVQHQAVEYLSEYLQESGNGEVRICDVFKYHGKIYQFESSDGIFATIIGSSNLGSIYSNNRTYEADILFQDQNLSAQIETFLEELVQKASIKFSEYTDPRIVDRPNALLDGHDHVSVARSGKFQQLYRESQSLSLPSFDIPLKTKERSHLNCFFGKGRENSRGFVKPRHWYETEVIVSNRITQQQDYPRLESFDVITDDGWKFRCKTQGDYSKNFRSESDLQILGKWLKGRLEQHGALKVGEPFTENVIEKYGRDSFELRKSSSDGLWLLNFKV